MLSGKWNRLCALNGLRFIRHAEAYIVHCFFFARQWDMVLLFVYVRRENITLQIEIKLYRTLALIKEIYLVRDKTLSLSFLRSTKDAYFFFFFAAK